MNSKKLWLNWFQTFKILAISAYQTVIISDEDSVVCRETMNTLILEGKWLAALVFAQLIKTIICTLVSFILYCIDDQFDPYEIARPSYNERMDALPTENSYVNFTNEEVDADTEQ